MDSKDEVKGEWVPFSNRPEWADVQPVPQDDGPDPVVVIDYKDEFIETMNYFRAVYLANERTPRSLDLTREAISLNPGNYTVWQFRRLILEHLSVDLNDELHFLDQVATENPKNYQIWHHRRWVSEKVGVGAVTKELEFTRRVFSRDAKNYHAWSHRRWVLQNLGGWEDELSYCTQLLNEDICNNSAWNQRYFVVTNSPLLGGLDVMRDSEVAIAIKAILAKPGNESPWRYLRGLYRNDVKHLGDDAQVASVCTQVLKGANQHVHALNLVLDILGHGFEADDDLKSAIEAVHSGLELPAPAADSELAVRVCFILEKIDPIRASYWEWRKSTLPSRAS